MRAQVPLVHGPTPIVRSRGLSELLGVELFVKRDDATGGAESGNKLRKLEFLLAEALEERRNVVITCGGTQSNHARATAIACAMLGLRCVLFLRKGDLEPPAGATAPAGNVLLDRLVGAEIRPITKEEYRERAHVMAEAARQLEEAGERPYVIHEGGSSGLGALGYVEAMREIRVQLDHGLAGGRGFDVVAHACGSGGTAAGVVLGAIEYEVAREVRAFAVCDDRAYFEPIVRRIVAEARALEPSLKREATWTIDDTAKGPAYAAMSEEQRAFLVRAARKSGIVLDPVYTGKALFGVAQAVARGAIPRGSRVLFIHTGGLPGLLAQGHLLEGVL